MSDLAVPRVPASTLAMVLACACTSGAVPIGVDARAPMDVGAVNDLATDVADTFDAGVADATFEDVIPSDADVLDVGRDAHSTWGDATLVDLGGILVPVDLHAIPAPGSECTSDASVREGDPSIEPPRPILPLSVSRVTSQRPTFRWVLPGGTTGARIEICEDRCCTRVIQSFDAEGTSARPMNLLPPGVAFWRMFGLRAGVVGARASYTWEFGVRHRDAANDTSWGGIRDFNGDGFDDLLVVYTNDPARDPSVVLLAPGSLAGLRTPPLLTVPGDFRGALGGEVGDFNGDGMADSAWTGSSGFLGTDSTWISVVYGRREGVPGSIRVDIEPIGMCAEFGRSASVVDWNGDGYSDVIISVRTGCNPIAAVTASLLFVYLGSGAGVGDIPQVAERIDERVAFPYVAVHGGVSDVDLDGYGDVLLGSYFTGGGSTHALPRYRIAHGSNLGAIWYGVVSDVGLDDQVTSTMIGDMDGDHYPEVALVERRDPTVRLFRFAEDISGSAAQLMDPAMGAYFGYNSSGGDLNGDGLADLIVTSEQIVARSDDGGVIRTGRDYVFLGANASLPSMPIWIERARSGDVTSEGPFGAPMVCPGDINGDGFDDIVLGDRMNNSTCTYFGRPSVVAGSPDQCERRISVSGAYFL